MRGGRENHLTSKSTDLICMDPSVEAGKGDIDDGEGYGQCEEEAEDGNTTFLDLEEPNGRAVRGDGHPLMD